VVAAGSAGALVVTLVLARAVRQRRHQARPDSRPALPSGRLIRPRLALAGPRPGPALTRVR
jgi:hypothetical protein